MKTIYEFSNGLRLAHREMKGVRSVAIGVTTAAGSAGETPETNGISHFIEHMCFKGTPTRSAFQIAAEVDGLGAQINAFTSKQATCYYTVSVDDQAEKCAEILSDIVFNSVFDAEELSREKGVVLEEIDEAADDTSDLCLENLGKAYFGAHPLGMPILGTKETVQSFTPADLKNYMQKNYLASSSVVAIVGNITAAAALGLVEKYFDGKFAAGERAWADAPHVTKKSYEYTVKDAEQSGLALAFPSYKFNGKNDMALRLLNTVFGGGMSSRLFQSVRERRGLAYSVFSYPSAYVNNGYMSIYAGINPKNAQKALKTVKDEITLLKKDGISREEFERGKQQLKGAYVLGQEQSSSIMQLLGKFALFANEEFNFSKKVEEINKVTEDEVREVIEDIFDFSKVSASYAGKAIDFNVLEALN